MTMKMFYTDDMLLIQWGDGTSDAIRWTDKQHIMETMELAYRAGSKAGAKLGFEQGQNDVFSRMGERGREMGQ